MFKRISAVIGFSLFVILACTPVMAQNNENPYRMIKQVADKTFARIAADQPLIATDANHLKTIVADKLMPYINHRLAAKIILGRTKASKADKKAFYTAFEKYLVTTYATVFAQYSNQTVKFEPEKPIDGKKLVMVKTRLVSPGVDDIKIDFKVRKNSKTGQWKAYDLKAMGVSLLDSKKAELAPMLRQSGGVQKVTALLNKKAASDIAVDKKISQR